MCGIAGYLGSEEAVPIVLDSLSRLQYRGYDSAGYAILNSDSTILVRKSLGQITNLRDSAMKDTYSRVGIGHTRWATHGKPTLENTHPLVSCDGSIAVVHNGVIENYLELRGVLERSGHRFVSETDSEVIPHILEESVRGGRSFVEAFSSLPTVLKGSFAVVAMVRGELRLYLARRGAPLVVGVSDTGYHPASDIPSFLPYTSKVVYLRQDDCLEVHLGGIRRISDQDGNSSPLDPTEIRVTDASLGEAEKGKFDHFMIKEIYEQGEVIQRLVDSPSPELGKLVAAAHLARKVYVVGIGTSYHSALFLDRLAHLSGVDRFRAVVSSEIEQYEPHLTKDSLVLVLSQSGETADTLAAAGVALKNGAQLWGMLNEPSSSLGRICQGVVPISCGRELAVAATKSYTAQLALLVQLLKRYLYHESEAEQILRDSVVALYELTAESTRNVLKEIAVNIVDTQDIFVLGRGIQNVTAREAALKLKEVAGIRAEAFYMGEMKHGPLALINDGSIVVIFHGERDKTQAEVSASELRSRGAKVISVGPEPLKMTSWHVRTSEVGTGLPITQIVPIQLLSYEIATLRRLNPDCPKNLAKSVTVA
ncbi:MAG: glutamine--fructose-6-phosphate transaminase (isomerizing) [Nitrososphaerota archaeon]|nr:glutamine--fructose-6-phosphate transaminase (isomerizing) [Nitrososphaerota archaeon]